MSSTGPPIRSYVLMVVLSFLIVKLGLTSVFVCTRRPALLVPILEAMPAFATDGRTETQRGESAVSSLSPNPDTSQGSDEAGTTLSTLEQKRAEGLTGRQLLQKERKRLTALEKEIDAKLSRLTKMQDEIQSKLAEHKTVQDSRIKHLIKIYTTMPPKKAAALIERLDMKVIIALFSKMKGENVGRILPNVSAEKAAKISERLAKLSF